MPMHTMGVLILEPPTRPIFDPFRGVVQERLRSLAPFCRRLVEDPLQLGDPYWIEDPGFTIASPGSTGGGASRPRVAPG